MVCMLVVDFLRVLRQLNFMKLVMMMVFIRTIEVNEGLSGYYIYLNSPESSIDYSAKEILTGQQCAYGEFDDRYLPPVEGDTCFGPLFWK